VSNTVALKIQRRRSRSRPLHPPLSVGMGRVRGFAIAGQRGDKAPRRILLQTAEFAAIFAL
jgi:hypothetical protein